MSIGSWSEARKEFIFALKFLLTSYKKPLWLFKAAPQWSLRTLCLLNAFLAFFCGFLGGIISLNPIKIILSIIFLPFVSLALHLILSILTYQICLRIFKKNCSFKEIASKVFISLIPFWLIVIFTGLTMKASLLGFFTAYIFLSYGLSEYLEIPKKSLFQAFGVIYALFIFSQVNFGSVPFLKDSEKTSVTKESLNILEKEFNF